MIDENATSRSLLWKLLAGYILLGIVMFSFGNSFPLEIHDNADSSIAWYSLLKRCGLMFAPNSAVVPFMGGMERRFFPSEFQIVSLLFYVLPVAYGYIAICWLKVGIGFFSFYFLCQRIFPHLPKEIGIGCALCFAFLPGLPTFYIAQASLPLLVLGVISLLERSDFRWYILFFIYPIFSNQTITLQVLSSTVSLSVSNMISGFNGSS